MKNEAKSVDISSKKLVSLRDAQEAHAAGANLVLICESCVVTPSARDFLAQHNIALKANCNAKTAVSSAYGQSAAAPASSAKTSSGSASQNRPAANPRLFFTPEAEAIKKEICAVGRKLWMRQFVDGNGGNISYRIGPNEVICTPTLVSKYDLTPEDLSLVDLDGNQIAGARPRTSEIFLHLEIYKAVPEAKSAVHCHPPHATAYAITGKVPPNLVIPEFEVFVGKVAISPYETPGTAAFAQTVLPFVKQHNTVLLSNHGIVCWADTVTHAEWYAEVLETYCWTLMLAAQLGTPISHISQQQGADLLALKKKLGLPDARFDTSRMKECQLSDLEVPGSIALTPNPCDGNTGKPAESDLEALVKSVTDAVMNTLGAGK
ncbi:MAG: class II aldolase/adducin family protein [Terracidiphilus sp.]|nr:class II aldolase/adducin family protein [Terracidiphilus sp.]